MTARNGTGPAIAETMTRARKIASTGKRGSRSSSQKAEPAQLFNKRTWRKLPLEALEARITQIQQYAGKGNILNLSQWKLVDRMRKRAERLAAEGAGVDRSDKIVSAQTTASLADLATQINAEHEAATNALQSGLDHAVAAGRLLIKAKLKIASHGDWLPWLKANCTFSARSAQGYMKVAKAVANLGDDANAKRVALLSLRDALAEFSTPVERSPSKSTGTAVVVAEPSNGKAVAVVDQPNDPIQEPCTDCETPEEFWQRSLSNLASDAISMRAFWTRQFGEWKKFKVPSDLVTLAEQAAEAWATLARQLKPKTRRDTIDQVNGFHRELMSFLTGFSERFNAWCGSKPSVDEHGKAELRQALLLCSEGILRLIQELD